MSIYFILLIDLQNILQLYNTSGKGDHAGGLCPEFHWELTGWCVDAGGAPAVGSLSISPPPSQSCIHHNAHLTSAQHNTNTQSLTFISSA